MEDRKPIASLSAAPTGIGLEQKEEERASPSHVLEYDKRGERAGPSLRPLPLEQPGKQESGAPTERLLPSILRCAVGGRGQPARCGALPGHRI